MWTLNAAIKSKINNFTYSLIVSFIYITGYGNIYPTTSTGQVLTIIYAFIGIPLALITIILLGSLFAKGCKILWRILVHSLALSTSIVSKDIEKQVCCKKFQQILRSN